MSIILSDLKTYCFSKINLNVSNGEKIAIIGENGVGKTTFLRTLLGLVPFEGKINILNKELIKKNDFQDIYKNIGYLFQDSDDSFLSSSVLEEVAFNLYNLSEDYNFSIQKTLELLEKFDILNLKDEIPIKLSGGQKRIVAFCACILSKPKLLLLDEPTNHLDEKRAKMVEHYIKNYEQTVVLVTHDVAFAKKVTDKIYKLTNENLDLIFKKEE